MPPAFLFNFASGGGNPNMTMGDEMGMINDNGTEVDMGRKLVLGSWNAQESRASRSRSLTDLRNACE